jgi:molecular chaperone HscB
MLQCPSCLRPQKPQLICPDCKSPLAADLDCFAALGIPRKLQIDTAMLESAYHELSRTLHPDRYAGATPEVRDASLRAMALVTRAYRTLRDPAARANYWLELYGHRLAENNQQVPAALAALVFEVQEELAELRDPNNSAQSVTRARIELRRREVEGLLTESSGALGRAFLELDAAAAEVPAELVTRLKATLAEGAYLATLLRDLNKALDSRTAA